MLARNVIPPEPVDSIRICDLRIVTARVCHVRPTGKEMSPRSAGFLSMTAGPVNLAKG